MGYLTITTHYALRATIVKLTESTEANHLHVKYKCALTVSGRWFVLHGKEEMLKSLEENWSKVSFQTGWRLEQCTKPSDTMSTIPKQTVDNVPVVGDDKLTNGTTVASTASTDVDTISTEINCSEDMEPNTLSNQDHRSTGNEFLNESNSFLGFSLSSSPVSILNTFFDVLCSFDITYFTNLVIIGDFDVDMLSSNCNHLTNIMHSYSLSKVVTEPTRIRSDNNSSLINLVLMSALERSSLTRVTSGVPRGQSWDISFSFRLRG